MGICVCNKDKDNKIKKKKNSIIKKNKNRENNENKNIIINTTKEEDFIIENKTDSTIIKKIGQINGEAIKISSNINCNILIFDFSSSIYIQNCENCLFLLSPCSSSIQIRNCKNINAILAAAQIRLTNINSGNFYSYTCSPIAIELCNNICLGNFFVQYTELSEMFHKSNLNIWNNRWSQYNEFGKNENIFYDNEETKNFVVDKFLNLFNECYINYDQYQFLPFTYGKSIDLSNDLYKNVLIVFKAEDLCEEELLRQITPYELEEKKVKCVSSLVLLELINNYWKIIEKIKKNSKNKELIDFLNNKNNNYATLTKNSGMLSLTKCTQRGKGSSLGKLNEMDLTGTIGGDSNRKFLQKGDLLLLWFVSENMDLNEFKDFIQNLYEQGIFGWITNEDVDCEEKVFQDYLFKIFFS